MASPSSSSSSFLYVIICALILCHGCLAQLGFDLGQGRSPWQSPRRFGAAGQAACTFDRLDVVQPQRRIQSEAGYTEYFEQFSQQFQCAGVSALRRVIEPSGLAVPSYSNAPLLVYIVQGRGVMGAVFPGCPETFQSFQQQFEQQQEEGGSQRGRFRDEHQKVHRFREGDIIALPAGVSHWCYNDGDSPVVAITVFDTSNTANQLDPRHREFLLAGRQQSRSGQQVFGGPQQEQPSGNNILSGFDTQLLAEAFGVNHELARRLQGQNDQRGEIVRVRHGLQWLRPSRTQQEEQQQQQPQTQPQQQQEEEEEEERRRGGQCGNGLEEMYCALKTRANINEPSRADIYNPQGGRITHLNAQKFPILNLVQMSATRVVLHRNALLAPYWNINAHSVMYVTRGRGRVQVVNHRGRTVFDGELRQGQLIIIPQNFAVAKRAQHEGFEWVSFNTNANAMVSHIAGKASALRGLPVDVLVNAYRISREEAQRLKYNRGDQMAIFAPRFEGRSINDQ
ncbi:glutelin type-B 5-like [Ananas comosus]|uniref:Glutelin type-B 5-like n=1 Tax=Ananas comosus TaxID=4615 RepID=A0A6P5EH05_ANACO|nr:glutelin type-B 5-like [Ananas comosus]XP_020113453.1 glutelin type-B 5-like [Ananas comosus]